MKKILSILLILLVACSFVFATEKTVKVTGKIEAGSGSNTGDGDVTFDGVNIAVAIAKDSNGYMTSDPPNNWDAGNFETVTTNASVTVDLMKDPTDSTNPDTFYIAVGVNGNPENTKTVTVEFAVDGWYKGDSILSTALKESNMSITQLTSESTENGKVKAKASSSSGEDGVNDTLTITHAPGLQNTKVLAGYSKIDWNVTGNHDAGNYTAQVKVTISEGQ